MRILEELANYILENLKSYPGNLEVAENTSYLVRLIKKFDKENNNGWIPVTERLPKYEETYYCTVKVRKGIKGMQVGVIIGMECVYVNGVWKNVWFEDISHIFEVIAWQPLSELYEEERAINKELEQSFLNGEISIHVTSKEQQRKLINYVKSLDYIDEFYALDKDHDSYIEFPYFFIEFSENGVSINLNASTGVSYNGESFNLEIVEFEDLFGGEEADNE